MFAALDSEPQPPRVSWEAQRQQPSRVPGTGSDEQLRVGVAADDPVHDDHVGRLDRRFLLGKVSVAPFDPRLCACLFGERTGLVVVAVRQLDDHRLLRPQSE